MEILRATELQHYFSSGKKTVQPLRGIDLVVRKGQFVAITGPSGCGKTTLLLACGAMRKPSRGVVCLAGDDVYALPASRRAALRSAKIGFLFQTMELIPYLTVLDNLLLVPGADATNAARWLSTLGLTDRAHHKPDTLSQGEKQRAALARAMVHDPMLVIADEPTGNLDPRNTEAVFESLRQYAEMGGAVLVASHETDIARSATATYRLESGCLVSGDFD